MRESPRIRRLRTDLKSLEQLRADSTILDFNVPGPMYGGPDCDLNISGAPDSLRIFSVSTEEIWLQPNSTGIFFIYAPQATVQTQPKGETVGVVWADNVVVKPQSDVWIDTSLLNKIKLNRIVIESWKEIRG